MRSAIIIMVATYETGILPMYMWSEHVYLFLGTAKLPSSTPLVYAKIIAFDPFQSKYLANLCNSLLLKLSVF